MSSSDKGDTAGYRIAQVSTAHLTDQFRLSPEYTGALTNLASLSPALEFHRENIVKQLAPTLGMFNQLNYNLNIMQPELTRLASTMFDIKIAPYQIATSPGMQALAESLRSFQQFDWAIAPEFTESLRSIVSTSLGVQEATRQMFQTPGFSEALQGIAAASFKLNNFAEMYTHIALPLTETLRAAYEGTKIFDNFDFSVLDNIDEDAFEEFLGEHPELVETYESIERTIVRKGLISKETFSRAGGRFKSSKVAKHLMIAVIMFSAGAALMFGVKSLPDDLEDEGVLYLTFVGLLYTVYGVHSAMKKIGQPPAGE